MASTGMEQHNIAIIVGSLRNQSVNRRVALIKSGRDALAGDPAHQG